ncbi:MAG: M20/M25/M40 family metallo-hydrolase, partial [Pirellulales bacterium]|nr:M20/M25/M40 family metallo-hydrolase [Pirellulales bacterium]
MTDADARKILEYLIAHREDMVELLIRYACLESPSRVPASQSAMFQGVSDKLDDLGFRCRRISGRRTGGQLLAIPRDDRRGTARQLIVGHVDTVWPRGTLETMPVRSRGGKVSGPGVYDMKAGIVQALFALQAIRDLGLTAEVTPLFFLNSDEEIGSPESTQNLLRLAKIVDRALVVEPSLGSQGLLKTARKGVGRFTVKVLGRSAHAGLDPDKGISAILELSHVIQHLFGLNDPQAGTTVNVG